jgi:ATP-dependent Clp endopeptidase proteolytic subunit ClpP
MHIDMRLNPTKSFSPKVEDFLKKPKVITVNKFDESSAKDFNKEFAEALETGQTIIPVIIDSFGGQVYSLFSMVDTIKNSNVPVATIAIGKTMSCGAVLLSAGNEGMRYASPNAIVLIHEVSSLAFGKNEEIQSDADHTKKLNKKLFEMISLNCGKQKNYFEKIYRNEKARADWYLDAKEAQSHNLINHIGIPKIIMKLNIEMNLFLND